MVPSHTVGSGLSFPPGQGCEAPRARDSFEVTQRAGPRAGFQVEPRSSETLSLTRGPETVSELRTAATARETASQPPRVLCGAAVTTLTRRCGIRGPLRAELLHRARRPPASPCWAVRPPHPALAKGRDMMMMMMAAASWGALCSCRSSGQGVRHVSIQVSILKSPWDFPRSWPQKKITGFKPE